MTPGPKCAMIGFRHDSQKGDTVVVASPNCAEWAIVIFAVLPLGGIISGVNPSYTEGMLNQTLFSHCPACDFTKSIVKSLEIVQNHTKFPMSFAYLQIFKNCKTDNMRLLLK